MKRAFSFGPLLPFGLLICGATAVLLPGCGGGGEAENKPAPPGTTPPPAAEQPKGETPNIPNAITAADITLGEIDKAMMGKGAETYNVKCQSCHTLTEKRVVGPGWKGITQRRDPVWIMNMIVHTDAMLSADTAAQRMLEECLVRMPNQNLSVQEAREVLELMRSI